MSKSIHLHRTLGLNPRMVNLHCLACGKTECDSLALLGSGNTVDTCPQCGTNICGGLAKAEKCPKCSHSRSLGRWQTRPLGEHEQIEQNGICSECRKWMERGIILISVRDENEGSENPFRTGAWIVIKEDALRRLVDGKTADEICLKRMAFVADSTWNLLGLPRNNHDRS